MRTTYHGVEVTEDYRWLEDAAAEAARSWTTAQDRQARDYLEHLPGHDAVRRRAAQLLRADSARYSDLRAAGGRYFAFKEQPPRQQPFLVGLAGLDDLASERVLVDPNVIDDSGATTIDWYQPSPDGQLVAVSLSAHGTEDGTVHVYQTSSGQPTGVAVPRVTGGTAGGSLAWAGDSSGFWYTRYPSPGERPDDDLGFYQEVWYHPLGETLAGDRPERPGRFADDRIAENFLNASPDGRWVMDRAEQGDGGQWQVFVRAQSAGPQDWWLVADVEDQISYATFGPDGLYLLSRRDAARGTVLRLPLRPGATVAQAAVVIPQPNLAIESAAGAANHDGGLVVTGSWLWLQVIDGHAPFLLVYRLDSLTEDPGWANPAGAVTGEAGAAIDTVVRLGGDDIAYTTEGYTEPRSWWQVSGTGTPRRTALVASSPLDFSGYEVSRQIATSPDGTRVPITLISPRGLPRDGHAPVLLTGYGGYGFTLTPRFTPSDLLWLEQGGVLAIAHIRGGGEYGQAWHHAGRLTAKQNVFDDFAACARHLIDSGLTSSARLALLGGSNGGLLMGAMVTQHPDLARAVVAMVPVLDMLRVELHPNGAFNVTEYGTVEDPAQFRALYAYSPYHHVKDGTAYPAVLLTAGEFDPRVDAYHAKKMAARLQAATSSAEPVLLRIEAGGHGLGRSLDQQVSELADVYTFLFDQLGVDYRS
ncbi:MAG: S9 family peptidase [Actinobacteria bacterium]|nr:S9 family peptidase [Actinomycetota bacterium]